MPRDVEDKRIPEFGERFALAAEISWDWWHVAMEKVGQLCIGEGYLEVWGCERHLGKRGCEWRSWS